MMQPPLRHLTLNRCIAALIVVKGALFVLLLPPWQGPDESARLEPAVIAARSGMQTDKWSPDLVFQKEVVASMRLFRAWDFYERKEPPPEVQDFSSANLPAGGSFLYEPALSYLPAGSFIRWFHPATALGAMYAARSASLMLHLLATLLVAVLGLQIFPGPSAAPLRVGLVLMYGLQPQISFMAASVHPDNFGLLLGMLVLVLLLLVARRAEVPGLSMSWVGPLCLMSLITLLAGQIFRKLIILVPYLLIVLPVIFWPRIRKAGRLEGSVRLLWVILIVAFLFALALYLNPQLFGSRLHWAAPVGRAEELKQTGVFGGWIRYAGILFATFWMALGSLVHKLSPTWLALMAIGLAGSAWGWLALWKPRGAAPRRKSPIKPLQAFLLALWLGAVLVSILAAYGHPASNVEGRYLLMALPAIAALWMAGLSGIDIRGADWNPVLIWTSICQLLNFVVLYSYLIPIYYLSN